MKQALVVIDIQNDYFPEGNFPLWNADTCLKNTLSAMAWAKQHAIPIVLVQHVSNSAKGPSGLFDAETHGVEVHQNILATAPNVPIVVKRYADSFYETTLNETLQSLGAEELLLCGMMTQNCVTHTALSKAAERYSINVLTDCCTTVSEAIHKFAISALKTRPEIKLINLDSVR